MNKLDDLRLNNNRIHFLPVSMSSLASLRVCSLHHNDLYIFPRQLHLCRCVGVNEGDGMGWLARGCFVLHGLCIAPMRPPPSHPSPSFPRRKLRFLDVSWNIRLRGKYFNVQKHDASIDYRRDLLPMSTLFRLLRYSLDKLDGAAAESGLDVDSLVAKVRARTTVSTTHPSGE